MTAKIVKGKSPPPPNPNNDLKTLPMPEVEKRLGSSANGLTAAEALARLTKDGPGQEAAFEIRHAIAKTHQPPQATQPPKPA